MNSDGRSTSQQLYIPTLLVIGACEDLEDRCLHAADESGLSLKACSIHDAPHAIPRRRPLAIVVPNGISDRMSHDLEVLARDVRSVLLLVDPDVSTRELQAMFSAAIAASSSRGERRSAAGRYSITDAVVEEAPFSRPGGALQRPSSPPSARNPALTAMTKSPVAAQQPPSMRSPAMTPVPPSVRGPAMTPTPMSVRGPAMTPVPPSVRGPAMTPVPPSVRGPAMTPVPPSVRGPAMTPVPPSVRGPAMTPVPPSVRGPAMTPTPMSVRGPAMTPVPPSVRGPAMAGAGQGALTARQTMPRVSVPVATGQGEESMRASRAPGLASTRPAPVSAPLAVGASSPPSGPVSMVVPRPAPGASSRLTPSPSAPVRTATLPSMPATEYASRPAAAPGTLHSTLTLEEIEPAPPTPRSGAEIPGRLTEPPTSGTQPVERASYAAIRSVFGGR